MEIFEERSHAAPTPTIQRSSGLPIDGKSGRSLTEHTIILIGGRALANLFALAVPVILARIFSREEYGTYRLVYLIQTSVQLFSEMGLSQSLYYFIPRERDKRHVIMWQTFLLVLVSAVVSLVLLWGLKRPLGDLLNNRALVGYLPCLAIYGFFTVASSFLEASLIAENRIKAVSYVFLVSNALNALLAVGAGMLYGSVLSVIGASIIYGGLRFLFAIFYMVSAYSFNEDVLSLNLLRKQLAYSLPLGFSNFSFNVKDQLHKYFVSHFFGPGVFAGYSVGTFRLPFAEIPANMVSNLLIPRMSVYEKENKQKEIVSVWNESTRKASLFIVPLVVFLVIMAEEFIVTLFTKKYSDSARVFAISALSLYPFTLRPSTIIRAYADTKFMMYIGFIRIPIEIVVLYSLITWFGIQGAVVGTLVTMSLERAVYLFRASLLLSVPIYSMMPWKALARTVVFSCVAGLPLLLTKAHVHNPFLSLCVAGFVFILIYVPIGWSFRLFTNQDKILISEMCRKYVGRFAHAFSHGIG